jgi:type IV pilus assembly protein PilC
MSLSAAMGRHPRAFPVIFHRAVAAGEQGGNLEIVLRQMADYMERGVNTEKKIRSALTYPIIVAITAAVVIIILVTFVLPKFMSLFTAFGAELPLATRILLSITDWFGSYGLYLLMVIFIIGVLGFIYARTPAGKYQWHKLSSRACRTIGLLFKVGLPLPEIMAMAIHGTSNKAMAEALSEVQRALIRGEGIARPMAQRKLFLPLMVQMVGVGEETGNLDNTLATVAQSYEIESDDRTTAAVGLIQPAMIVVIGLGVGFIAVALLSAMYGIYGQVSF